MLGTGEGGLAEQLHDRQVFCTIKRFEQNSAYRDYRTGAPVLRFSFVLDGAQPGRPSTGRRASSLRRMASVDKY